MTPDREHIVTVPPGDMDGLREWLARPNGAHNIGRVTFEAVAHGGIFVRTWPYGQDVPQALPCAAKGEDYGQACELPTGHEGRCVDVFGGHFGIEQKPERCGQRHILQPRHLTRTELVCTLPAEHHGDFHRADDGSTWSRAGDLQGPPSLQHDACGARLTIHGVLNVYPRTMSHVCVAGPHDANDMHRAADGTQWRASDFPPTAPGRLPLCGMASSPADGWYGVCDRPAGHDGGHRQFADPDPKGTAALVELLQERGELIAKYQAALSRKGECICPVCRETGVPDDLDELCPQHGTVAELVTQLRWAASFTDRIMAALGEPWTEPFHGGDAAEEAARRIDQGDLVDAVQAELREAGIVANATSGVRDLASQRDSHAEHAENCERALTRIADMARLAAAGAALLDSATFGEVLARIIAVTEEKNR